MLKKEITYTDYNGDERTENFYFNLTKAEMMEMELTADGGLENMLDKMRNERDMKKFLVFFKGLILKAYGEKSPDGKRFIKSEEISAGFEHTEAYSELFMQLYSNPKELGEFLIGIIPGDIAKEAGPAMREELKKLEKPEA